MTRILIAVLGLCLVTAPARADSSEPKMPGSTAAQQEMGSCGSLNSTEATYTTREDCEKRGQTFVPGVQPYSNMYVVSACSHAATLNQAQITVAIFRPQYGEGAEVETLASQHVSVLRNEGLITTRPVLTLRSNDDGTIIQILEWSPESGSDAHTNPQVQAIWSQLAEKADFAPLGQLAENSCAFSSYALLAEE